MKRSLCISLSALLILSAFSACKPQNQSAVKTTPEPETTAVSEVTKAPEITALPSDEPTEVPAYEPTAVPTEVPTAVLPEMPESKLEKLDIPVFPDEKLFFTPSRAIGLGFDFYSLCTFSGVINNPLSTVLELLPANSFRKAGSGEEYIVYDSENGYREFVFIDRDSLPVPVTAGYVIVIGETHSYKAFEQLKIGDSIEKVEAIDSVASLHKRYFLDVSGYVPQSAAERAKGGNPLCSIHYLTDGLLKIEYEMLKDRTLVISNIVYAKDYTLNHTYSLYDSSGNTVEWTFSKTINYRIEPIDLPER